MGVSNEPEMHDSDVLAALDAAVPEPDERDLAALRARLAEDAEADGVLDVAYRTVDSPYGELLVAATPLGVVRVAFEREGHDTVLAELAARISPRILRTGIRTDEAARQLDEYFAGTRRAFELPVDLRLVDGFRRTVVSHLPDIGYGSTASYAALAAAVGSPKAVRAVGSACANNPVPVVVPCHRVVRSDGSIGQYLGGAEVKAALLELESAA